MTLTVPQTILDSLTDVAMPRRMPGRPPDTALAVGGQQIPVYRCEALVLGSGAAGLRAAVELKRRGVDVLVATQTLFWGTSACSGSDKQTLHTASTSRRGDHFVELARAIGAGGAMDADTAYVEAVGSIDALAGLRYVGLPVPEDRYGAVLRYQTDHDEAGRATSCGPRTSRLMVKVLAEEALRLGIPFVNRTTGIALVVTSGAEVASDEGNEGNERDERNNGKVDRRHVSGLLAIRTDARTAANPYGLTLFAAPAIVLATGGPGELYRDSVYPTHCFGSLGLALEAGVELTNLTESQFGIGTRRDDFPWNLSGTYVQAMPYIHSVDAAGCEHNFLAGYYRTTQELASNIFRKGYQWPFHASRMLDYGSSLVDLAVFRESRAGRTVVMDFNRNPEPVPGDLPFSLDRLDADVRAYLANNDALLAMPIDRLRQMNPLSIELYRRYKHDLASKPLAFNVNNQHMNGGVAVDIWGQSSLAGCYAVGEAAGTHGVTRPGGAALNAGQVFAIRCAKHIAAGRIQRGASGLPSVDPIGGAAIAVWQDRIAQGLANPGGLQARAVRSEVQARMSDRAGFICHAADVDTARDDARALNAAIRTRGMAVDNAAQIANALLWRQSALASEAVLTALAHYVAHGGGSRGARVLCSAAGTQVPVTRDGPLEEFRFLAERDDDRRVQIRVRWDGTAFAVYEAELRDLTGLDEIFFEKNWAPFLTGAIYRDGGSRETPHR